MNLTKLASGAYDLKVTIDGKEIIFASNEFANANQLHKVLIEKLEGISSLKKSTFYGVKFEEIVPGVFVGERRIPGFGLYHFQFTGAPVAPGALGAHFDPAAAPSSLSESCSGGCDGNGSCENLCCKTEPNKILQPAANEDVLEVLPGFKLNELGSGIIRVISTDRSGGRYLLGGMQVYEKLDIGQWYKLLNSSLHPSENCVVDAESLIFFEVPGAGYYSAETDFFIFIFSKDETQDLTAFEPFKNPFEQVLFRDLGAGHLSIVDLRVPGSPQGEQLWCSDLGTPDYFWSHEAPQLYTNDLPEVWNFDHNNHPFFYDPASGLYVAERWPLRFQFKKATPMVCEEPVAEPTKKPTLKETFLGWLKNILG